VTVAARRVVANRTAAEPRYLGLSEAERSASVDRVLETVRPRWDGREQFRRGVAGALQSIAELASARTPAIQRDDLRAAATALKRARTKINSLTERQREQLRTDLLMSEVNRVIEEGESLAEQAARGVKPKREGWTSAKCKRLAAFCASDLLLDWGSGRGPVTLADNGIFRKVTELLVELATGTQVSSAARECAAQLEELERQGVLGGAADRRCIRREARKSSATMPMELRDLMLRDMMLRDRET
jgi:hypothetical protein